VDIFVETGTFLGDTTAWAARHFERVITVEAAPAIHETAMARHGNLSNVDFRLGDSRDLLSEIVDSLARPAIFWLDGHYSGWETAGAGDECPVVDELAAIRSSSLEHSVFIDDARMFLCAPPRPHDEHDWPTIDVVIEAVRQPDVDRHIAIVEDVVVAVPAAAADVAIAHEREISTRASQAQKVSASALVRARARSVSRALQLLRTSAEVWRR
jgi:hypothetical protein